MMASKAKQLATESFDELKRYLQRDGRAQELLLHVHRYMGELRQAKARLSDRTSRLEKALEMSQQTIRDQNTSLYALELELQKSNASLLQRTNELAEARTKMSALEQLLEPEEYEHDPLLETDHRYRAFKRTFKSLRRKMRHPPPLQGRHLKSASVIELMHVMKKFDDIEFATLGKLVAVLSIGTGQMGVICKPTKNGNDKQCPFSESETLQKAYFRWLSNWIGQPRWMDEIYYKQFGNKQ